MPFDARVVRVLLASPSDVPLQRDCVEATIHRWNADHAERRQLIVLPRRWEVSAVPSLDDRPQSLINHQFADDCDAIVGVFWTRLGSPTGAADSGTAEEIERGSRAGKPVALYFSAQPAAPETFDSAQMDRLRAFKKSMQTRGLVGEFGDLPELERSVSSWLTKIASDSFGAHDEGSNDTRPPTSPRARVTIELVRLPNARGGVDYKLRLVNVGSGRALNVSLSPVDPAKSWLIMQHASEPIEFLPSGADVHLTVSMSLSSPPRAIYIVRWTNEDGSDSEETFTLII